MSARIPVSEAHGQQKKRKPQTTSWSPLCAAEKTVLLWKEEEELQSVVCTGKSRSIIPNMQEYANIFAPPLTFLPNTTQLFTIELYMVPNFWNF